MGDDLRNLLELTDEYDRIASSEDEFLSDYQSTRLNFLDIDIPSRYAAMSAEDQQEYLKLSRSQSL